MDLGGKTRGKGFYGILGLNMVWDKHLEALPWEQQIIRNLTDQGPYFSIAALACGIAYFGWRLFRRSLDSNYFDMLAESFVVGIAAAGSSLLVLTQFSHLITGRPAAAWAAFLGISAFYPHIGISNILWFFLPWQFRRFSVGQKIVALFLAVLSLFLSLTLGTWAPNSTS